eukprot:1145836-Pelagomonas_calceolata.AAC.7
MEVNHGSSKVNAAVKGNYIKLKDYKVQPHNIFHTEGKKVLKAVQKYKSAQSSSLDCAGENKVFHVADAHATIFTVAKGSNAQEKHLKSSCTMTIAAVFMYDDAVIVLQHFTSVLYLSTVHMWSQGICREFQTLRVLRGPSEALVEALGKTIAAKVPSTQRSPHFPQ